MLEVLLAVARAGTVAQAGPGLGLSARAVSGRLRSWEERSGTRVLERGRGGGRLTAEGALLAEWAAPLLDTARELGVAVGALGGSGADRLAVAATPTVADHLLRAWLVRMHAEGAGGVHLTVRDTAEVARDVLGGGAALGFVEGPRPTLPDGLRSATVTSDRLVVVVVPQHDWAGRGVGPAELAAAAPATCGTDVRATLGVALAGAGVADAGPAAGLPTTAAVRAAALDAGRPAVASRLAVQEDLAAGRLVEVPVAGLDTARELRAVWPDATTPSGPARSLLRIATDGRIR